MRGEWRREEERRGEERRGEERGAWRSAGSGIWAEMGLTECEGAVVQPVRRPGPSAANRPFHLRGVDEAGT